MANKNKQRKRYLIKPGTPHPKYPSHVLVSSHKTESAAEKAEWKEHGKVGTKSTLIQPVPKQYVLYRSPKNLPRNKKRSSVFPLKK